MYSTLRIFKLKKELRQNLEKRPRAVVPARLTDWVRRLYAAAGKRRPGSSR